MNIARLPIDRMEKMKIISQMMTNHMDEKVGMINKAMKTPEMNITSLQMNISFGDITMYRKTNDMGKIMQPMNIASQMLNMANSSRRTLIRSHPIARNHLELVAA